METGNTHAIPESSINYLEENEHAIVIRAQQLLSAQIQNPDTLQHNAVIQEVLTRWRVRVHGIVAALILPQIEKELVPDKELTALFGHRAMQTARVALKHICDNTCDGENKAFRTELYRELLVHAFFNIEAVLICIADHLARASSLDTQSTIHQQKWAQKNMDVYAPLLGVLGMWAYKRDLGNLALAVQNLQYYEQLEQYVLTYYERTESLFNLVKGTLSPVLRENRIDAEVNLRYITAINLHWRTTSARKRGEYVNIKDTGILCVDVLLEGEDQCYLALGFIHNQWRPAHRHSALATGRFHDYIAVPQFNGYRCLITTVICDLPSGAGRGRSSHALVEFRIMTHEMEQINAHGIVAAMDNPLPVRNTWWADLALAEVMNPNSKTRKRDEIAIFTPTGEVVFPVSLGSTVTDFAFRIRADCGPYARRFWVNGRQVPHGHVLRHRDLVEIEYDMQYPSLKPEWIEHAYTSLARTNIRRFLNSRRRSPHRGRQLIDKVLQREVGIYRMRFSDEKVEHTLTKIAQRHKCLTLESLYIKIARGTLSPDAIVARMIENELVGHIVVENNHSWPVDHIRIARCWMQEKEGAKWDRAARIMPGTDIVGRLVGKPGSEILVVHRRTCRHAPAEKKAVAVRWSGTTTLREAAEITITAAPRPDVIGPILNTINVQGAEGLSLHRFHADLHDGNTIINLVVDAPSSDAIQKLHSDLKSLQKNAIITDMNVWQLFPGQKMLIAGKTDRRLRNPYTLRQIRDRSMFFGREDEINQIIDQVQSDQMFIILYGQKRIGKTSLLYQLTENLLPQSCDILPVPFDAHSLVPFDTIPFLLGLSETTNQLLFHRLKRAEDRRGLRLKEKDLQADPFGTFAAWVKQIQRCLQGTRLLFIIDEFTRAEEECRQKNLSKSFFGGLQWLVGKQNIGFLLCVHDNVYHQESHSWGMMQRGHPVRLDTLDYSSAALLVRQPLERVYRFESGLVDRILNLTNCHPYFIHAICMALISRMSRLPRHKITSDDLADAVSSVLKTGDHYFSHFRSPLDEHGWSTLKTMAYISGDENVWVSRDQIRAAMEQYGSGADRWAIAESISEIYRAGIIDARNTHQKVTYRIPIGLFQFWLRQRTHPLISRDMQPKD